MSAPLGRAVLWVPGERWTEDQPGPSELFHLVDRPFLHHVIESIAARGCRRVDVILGEWPEQVEAALGDGARWGVTIVYHLTRDPAAPLSRLRALNFGGPPEPVLLAVASTLPSPAALGSDDAVEVGWGIVPSTAIRRIPASASIAELREWMETTCTLERDAVSPPMVEATPSGPTLDARTPSTFLHAIRTVLQGRWRDLLMSGREVRPGVHMAWNARVHPRAKLRGPLFLGEQVWIGPDAEVGPFAAIGAGAMVDAGASVRDVAVEPNSYIGEGLAVERSVVRRHWLMNADLGVSLELEDPLLLGTSEARIPTRPLVRGVERTVAALLAMLTLPVTLATAGFLKIFRVGPVLYRPRVLRPRWRRGSSRPRDGVVRLLTFDPHFGSSGLASPRSTRGKDLLLRLLPGLWNVARGDLSFVGIEPRSPEVVRDLPGFWKALHRARPAGLVTEAEVSEVAVEADALFVFEAHFMARAGLASRAKVLGRYLTGRGPAT